jgi:hypothetical protein
MQKELRQKEANTTRALPASDQAEGLGTVSPRRAARRTWRPPAKLHP